MGRARVGGSCGRMTSTARLSTSANGCGRPGRRLGNAELEFYTDRPENARIEGGILVIEARREQFGNREYTSARLKTQGLGSWKYGRVEARIQIPRGQGLWPAFWMLGDNIANVGWPACGEIDIMENIGKEPGRVHGTIHGPGYSGGAGTRARTTSVRVPSPTTFTSTPSSGRQIPFGGSWTTRLTRRSRREAYRGGGCTTIRSSSFSTSPWEVTARQSGWHHRLPTNDACRLCARVREN